MISLYCFTFIIYKNQNECFVFAKNILFNIYLNFYDTIYYITTEMKIRLGLTTFVKLLFYYKNNKNNLVYYKTTSCVGSNAFE